MAKQIQNIIRGRRTHPHDGWGLKRKQAQERGETLNGRTHPHDGWGLKLCEPYAVGTIEWGRTHPHDGWGLKLHLPIWTSPPL